MAAGCGSRPTGSKRRRSAEFDDHRDVIGGLLLGAFFPVRIGGDQPLRQRGRQQGMVDAQAQVALPGAGLVVPEGLGRVVRVHRAHRIGQAEPEQFSKVLAGFGADEGVGGG